jgi:hypothetical protein
MAALAGSASSAKGSLASTEADIARTTVGLSQLVASLVAGVSWDRIGHPAVF